ncbi:methylenetetrahydrofolate reductase [Desulfuromonas versatilis]|uniref:Methylenetetrahydrofolate reductase n=1 Tax=Desulfuromonas versatilis TaxID=2802975 RepID=A0ABN6DY45_9BACT|nr:methylenetetrahydrofolate reductase [Desulfuromonas versatilis]BCR04129.1 methylenetetrahydrofolate reductase [Desulfuromonas versatilis]
MSKLQQQLDAGQFVVTAEIAPPKGSDPSEALAKARSFSGVTAINVTDNQGANMRMSPLALAALLVRQGQEPVLQLTCRDRNRLALQSDLLGAAALGVENLLILSGDHARFGDHPEAKSVFDLDSVQLLQAVEGLTLGQDLAGRSLEVAPRFCCGAAVSPSAEPFELMFQKFAKKVEAGAGFFQTQAVFDPPALERFMAAARPLGVPVLLGVLLVKSARMARFLNQHIPGVQVPEPLVERLEQAADPLDEGVAIARDMVAQARSLCQGVHLMTLGHEERIPEILHQTG